MVSLFCISMGNDLTVNMQYGENSMYNEIEHTQDTSSDVEETKVKLCQALQEYDLNPGELEIKIKVVKNEVFKSFFYNSNPTPPPESFI